MKKLLLVMLVVTSTALASTVTLKTSEEGVAFEDPQVYVNSRSATPQDRATMNSSKTECAIPLRVRDALGQEVDGLGVFIDVMKNGEFVNDLSLRTTEGVFDIKTIKCTSSYRDENVDSPSYVCSTWEATPEGYTRVKSFPSRKPEMRTVAYKKVG